MCNRKWNFVMSSRHQISSRIGNFFDLIGSAVAAASAVDRGRQPAARDLRALGIDPERFRQINSL
jgi:hypothetical protein